MEIHKRHDGLCTDFLAQPTAHHIWVSTFLPKHELLNHLVDQSSNKGRHPGILGQVINWIKDLII
jgi:hypothetical protein